MRGRKPKPTKVLEMSGAFKHNPARKRARAAKPTTGSPLGDPPAEWTEGAAAGSPSDVAVLKIWRRVVDQDRAVLKVLNASHWLLVKNYCELQYKVDRARKGYGKATSGDWSNLKSYLAAMGMTPIDSSHVGEAVRVPERGIPPAGRRREPGWGELVG